MLVNRLFNIDAISLLEKLEDNSVQLFLTDPPYFLGDTPSVLQNVNKVKNGKRDRNFYKDGTEWDRQWTTKDEYRKFIYKVLELMSSKLTETGHIVMFANKRDLSFFAEYGESIGLKFRSFWVWKKRKRWFLVRKVTPFMLTEYAVWFTKVVKQDGYGWELGMIDEMIEATTPHKEGGVFRHPSQKPFKVGLILTLFLSKIGDLVVDPFCGSGTFVVSASVLDRKWIGGDINSEYINKLRESFESRKRYAMKVLEKDVIPLLKNTNNERIKWGLF